MATIQFSLNSIGALPQIAHPGHALRDRATVAAEGKLFPVEVAHLGSKGTTGGLAVPRGSSLDTAGGGFNPLFRDDGLETVVRAIANHQRVAGVDISDLDDSELTKLRRDHIGFIFQFFNLLPMLNAEENIVLPLSIAGEKPDKEFFEDLIAAVSAGITQGRSLEELERTVLLEKYKGWAQYERLRVYNIRSAYQNLKAYR
jgi:putative ABC transport system ATP-binding protein